jgi:hypothetical protein
MRISPEIRAEIITALDSGMSERDVATKLGLSKTGVHKVGVSERGGTNTTTVRTRQPIEQRQTIASTPGLSADMLERAQTVEIMAYNRIAEIYARARRDGTTPSDSELQGAQKIFMQAQQIVQRMIESARAASAVKKQPDDSEKERLAEVRKIIEDAQARSSARVGHIV